MCVCIYVCVYDEEFGENVKQEMRGKILKLYKISEVPTFVRTALCEINKEEE